MGDFENLVGFRRRESELAVIAVAADDTATMHPVSSMAEASAKFEELRRAGLSQILIKNGNRTIRRLR